MYNNIPYQIQSMYTQTFKDSCYAHFIVCWWCTSGHVVVFYLGFQCCNVLLYVIWLINAFLCGDCFCICLHKIHMQCCPFWCIILYCNISGKFGKPLNKVKHTCFLVKCTVPSQLYCSCYLKSAYLSCLYVGVLFVVIHCLCSSIVFFWLIQFIVSFVLCALFVLLMLVCV